MLISVSDVRFQSIIYQKNDLFRLFIGDKTKTEFCEVTLVPEKYDAFVYAVKNHYWYQMFIDDLPIWG